MVVTDYKDGKLTFFDGLLMHETEYTPPKKKELYLPCACGSEVLRLEKYDDEEETYLSVYRYNSQSVSFFGRLKMCLKVLKGVGISTADVVISEDDFKKIKNFA